MIINEYICKLDSKRHPKLEIKEKYEYTMDKLTTPEQAADMISDLFNIQNRAEEYLYMIALNTKNKVVGLFEISHGTVNKTICSTREIMIRALLIGDVNLIFVHNHVSGEVEYSKEDKMIYEKLVNACGIMDVTLLDNIIIGKNNYYSFSEKFIQ